MSPLNGMTTEQLRQELADYFGGQQTQVPVPPLPAHMQDNGRTAEQLAKVSDNWLAYILSRPHSSWSAEEREAVRIGCARALAEGK